MMMITMMMDDDDDDDDDDDGDGGDEEEEDDRRSHHNILFLPLMMMIMMMITIDDDDDDNNSNSNNNNSSNNNNNNNDDDDDHNDEPWRWIPFLNNNYYISFTKGSQSLTGSQPSLGSDPNPNPDPGQGKGQEQTPAPGTCPLNIECPGLFETVPVPLRDLFVPGQRSERRTVGGKLVVSVARLVDSRGDLLVLDDMGISLQVGVAVYVIETDIGGEG